MIEHPLTRTKIFRVLKDRPRKFLPFLRIQMWLTTTTLEQRSLSCQYVDDDNSRVRGLTCQSFPCSYRWLLTFLVASHHSVHVAVSALGFRALTYFSLIVDDRNHLC